MKYDLIIIGGGPAGLMTAKIAAEDGLKVLLVERKKVINKISRACSQIFFINKLTASDKSERGEAHINGYVEPVSLEVMDDKVKLNFYGSGFSLGYSGPVKPYYDWIQVSPSGYQVHRYNPKENKIWGYYYNKEVLVTGLLEDAEKAGAEVWPEIIALGLENNLDGVEVHLRGEQGEQIVQARKAIAADGIQSKMVESLGLNQDRQLVGKPLKISHYVVEGLENIPPNSWISFSIPSITPFGTIPIGLWEGDAYQLEAGSIGTTPPHIYVEKFMQLPLVAPWFRHARVVKKLGCTNTMRQPIKEPVVGNAVIIGDAGAPDSTWIQGAIACGYQVAKATAKELDGKQGYSEYTKWWQQAFAFNRQDHFKTFNLAYSLSTLCTSEEIDYIYSLFQNRIGIPPCLVNKNMDLIKEDNPKLYKKLVKNLKA
jgi:flavin-dependent dehydrogenase